MTEIKFLRIKGLNLKKKIKLNFFKDKDQTKPKI